MIGHLNDLAVFAVMFAIAIALGMSALLSGLVLLGLLVWVWDWCCARRRRRLVIDAALVAAVVAVTLAGFAALANGAEAVEYHQALHRDHARHVPLPQARPALVAGVSLGRTTWTMDPATLEYLWTRPRSRMTCCCSVPGFREEGAL